METIVFSVTTPLSKIGRPSKWASKTTMTTSDAKDPVNAANSVSHVSRGEKFADRKETMLCQDNEQRAMRTARMPESEKMNRTLNLGTLR